MLFVTIIQLVAVAFTITALIQNTLMLSPEQGGVTCNITIPYVPKKNITAEHLQVYWGWQTLEVRWDFEGLTDTQIWFKETYKKTYDYRCKGDDGNATTLVPTPSPILHPKTPRPTKSPTPTNSTIAIIANPRRQLLIYNDTTELNQLIQYQVPLPMGDTIYYPFKITQEYSDYDYEQSTNNHTKGCDDLEIVIETGRSYFSLLVCGLSFECIALLLLIPPTCHIVNVKTRRLLKQIVIGLNTVSFMLLLMAFAIWFAYFSTNINQVIEEQGNTNFSVCLLGEPVFGESIAYVLSGWLLIGFATMSACYLSNRPKQWYRFLRRKRNFNFGVHVPLNQQQQQQQRLAINGTILEEESQSDCDSSSQNDSSSPDLEEENERERLGTLINRTPSNNSSGSNETYMTADGSFGHAIVMKGDMYPVQYSPN